MSIRFFDMFAGIGGFRSGLESVGGFECVGHCEIDKYANQAYNAIYEPKKGEKYFEDARTIQPKDLPDFDLICAGFPCQAFSVAGQRLGFNDMRGTLVFEVARLVAERRPAFLLLENVPGLLSHDQGRTLNTIFSVFVEMGYHLEWCVHNSKYFGVPQQRRRLYIVGHLDGRGAGEIFPLGHGAAQALKQLIGGLSDTSRGLGDVYKRQIFHRHERQTQNHRGSAVYYSPAERGCEQSPWRAFGGIDGRLAAGDSHAGARESTSARPACKRTERGDVHDYGAGSARGLASRQNPAPDAD